jgi:ABC-type lipoprotein release transport system permease subunit
VGTGEWGLGSGDFGNGLSPPFAVAQRTREIGIRLALSAGAPGVLQFVIAEGALLAGLGAVLGTFAALGLTRVLRSLNTLRRASISNPGCREP